MGERQPSVNAGQLPATVAALLAVFGPGIKRGKALQISSQCEKKLRLDSSGGSAPIGYIYRSNGLNRSKALLHFSTCTRGIPCHFPEEARSADVVRIPLAVDVVFIVQCWTVAFEY